MHVCPPIELIVVMPLAESALRTLGPTVTTGEVALALPPAPIHVRV